MRDPYGTAALREHVLAAWTASPTRFREDANAEEDYALGGYRDRVVVELAQNAADAAARAQVPGRLAFSLRDGVLVAANTGAPLDAAGVAALSTLRASAKRDETASVGRFGVGFAAVVAVSDEPRIASTGGAVRWSRARTRELLEGVPALGEELGRRHGHVPVLRLPFPADDTPPGGFTTAVTLPLRDADAESQVRRLLAETGPALLLALPALAEVEIDLDGTRRHLATRPVDGDVVVEVDGVPTRWRVAGASGALAPELLADRPTEERARPWWFVRWAAPLTPSGELASLPAGVPQVVHAPTPTAEPLGVNALLLASYPLAPDRRHVAAGPLADFVTAQAAGCYAELLADLPGSPRLLDLVPAPGGRGELDARLRHAIRDRLPDAPFLPAAVTGPRLRPRDAAVIDGPAAVTAVVADLLPGLLPADWPARHPALSALGVRRITLADLTDLLAGLTREPTWWRRLYEALASAEARDLVAELGALPVPLADGRTVRGPRGTLLPGPGLDVAGLAALPLRIVHPQAAHPLLTRLGAVEATPRRVLEDPATRGAVAASYDEEDPEPIAQAVLALVAAAGITPGELPWLADLALRGADGEYYPAGELLLPDGALAGLLAADAPFGMVAADLLERYGPDTLEAVGVLATFAVLRAEDVPLTDPGLDVDGITRWAADTLARLPPGDQPPLVPELVAVADLEFVRDFSRALELLAAPPLRAALVEPTRVVTGSGRVVDVPSYTAWWLRRHPVLGGRRPGELRAPGADPLLAGLYEEAPPGLDAEVLRALGVRVSVAELLAETDGPRELLDRLADPARPVTRAQLRGLWRALAALDPERVDPPERVRAVQTGEVVVADAEEVMVLDAPDLLPLVADRPLVLAPYHLAERLADLLDLPLVSEEVPGRVEPDGRVTAVPAAARRLLPTVPATYVAHETLRVDGREVAWRYVDGVVHAAGTAGLARGLALAAGRWEWRHLLGAVLASPQALADLLAEADLERR